MAKITLDSKTFQALASSTRLTVLRALDERRKTLTELARDLDLNKATVHEHLQLLTSAGLVRKRDDEGRKWIYYELTWTGERLLHPQETTTFSVLLGLTVAAGGGGVFLLGQALGWWLAGTPLAGPELLADDPARKQDPAASPAAASGTESGTAAPEQGMADSAFASTPNPLPDGFADSGWLGIVLLVASTVFLVLATMIRRSLRRGAKGTPDGEGASDTGSDEAPPTN